jgi:hypothetical protein
MRVLFLMLSLAGAVPAQYIILRNASPAGMPVLVDSNSPMFWRGDELRVFTSLGVPLVTAVRDQDRLESGAPQEVRVDPSDHLPMWIESVWQDSDGLLYAWYHHEPGGVCPNSTLTAPQIGALVSEDGGTSFRDLGIVLSSGDAPDCAAKNGFFAGGHGDFTVILDREQQYFYFFFGNYGGDAAHQGIAVARMAFEDRANPTGAVWKYYMGGWNQPGRGGGVTPILPAATGWQYATTDSYWGPSLHWNITLESYVMLLNRACCGPNWPQEGIYISFAADLSNPGAWTSPQKILRSQDLTFGAGYYPQIVGLGRGGTDSLSSSVARLYVNGFSRWEMVFVADPLPEFIEPEPPPGSVPYY